MLAQFYAVVTTEQGYQAVAAIRSDEGGFWHGVTGDGVKIVFVEDQVLAKFADADAAVAGLKRAQDTERAFRTVWARAIALANNIERDMRQATLDALRIGAIASE